VTNQHDSFETVSRNTSSVSAIPALFDAFQGYNETKRKRIKEAPLSANHLHSHAEALYAICAKPVMKSTAEWSDAYVHIKALADCFRQYEQYLIKKNTNQTEIHKLDHPVRQLSENCTVEHRAAAMTAVREQYHILDSCVIAARGEPVFFDENKHLLSPFVSRMQRLRFIDELKLSVAVDMYRYCPGGSYTTVVCVVEVESNRDENELLTQCDRIIDTMCPYNG